MCGRKFLCDSVDDLLFILRTNRRRDNLAFHAADESSRVWMVTQDQTTQLDAEQWNLK
jgi:hypothetical protein